MVKRLPSPLATTLALLLCTLASLSQAQSAYTLTTLRSPNGTAATGRDMDNTGKVVGTHSVLSFNTEDVSAGGLPKLRYRLVGTSWAAGTASTVTGSRLAAFYVPFKANQAGATAGFKTSDTTFDISGTPFVEKGGRLTALTLTNPADDIGPIVLGAINNSGTVVGTGYKDFSHTAAILKPGQIMRLARLANHKSTFAYSVNDQEQVAGAVLVSDSVLPPGYYADMRAAVWTNGQLSWVGEPQTEARVINNAGQVLIAKVYGPSNAQKAGAQAWANFDGRGRVKGSASVRLGDAVQTIGREDQVIIPTDMNNAGTVVGCADDVPFIWKNGVMLDLVKEVSSKGAKFPKGVLVECPMAINDSGSILISHRPGPYDFKSTWVRINAKP